MGGAMLDGERDELDGSPLNELVSEWDREVAELRGVGDRARWIADRVGRLRWEKPESHYLGYLVEEFTKVGRKAARRSNFDNLVLHSADLIRRGAGLGDPDYGPEPERSLFVRRIPSGSQPIRDPVVYYGHIQESIHHFVEVLTISVDCAINCDWNVLDDEFPKLAVLVDEVNKAYATLEVLLRE
ncbi:hypothetical protein IU449_12765 [Nocardia higoensis]|uniref:Uncharacterized protein n=1 Tax=Nocardia higoensis TaxID=228599 RepID=A0ABS0DAB1_9NOCA|nr:hypothetical protein [Nocardia higoensis]MBF6355405.1 hypothetical protein [Nocardia higoensis]